MQLIFRPAEGRSADLCISGNVSDHYWQGRINSAQYDAKTVACGLDALPGALYSAPAIRSPYKRANRRLVGVRTYVLRKVWVDAFSAGRVHTVRKAIYKERI